MFPSQDVIFLTSLVNECPLSEIANFGAPISVNFKLPKKRFKTSMDERSKESGTPSKYVHPLLQHVISTIYDLYRLIFTVKFLSKHVPHNLF